MRPDLGQAGFSTNANRRDTFFWSGTWTVALLLDVYGSIESPDLR